MRSPEDRERWRLAAKASLARLGEDGVDELQEVDAHALVLELRRASGSVLFAFSLEQGTLRWSSSGGEADATLLRYALEWLAGEGPSLPGLQPRSPKEEGAAPLAVALRGAEVEGATPWADSHRRRYAPALEDLILTCGRVGLRHAADSPLVSDALERLASLLPRPFPPPRLARFLMRMRDALARRRPSDLLDRLSYAARLLDDLERAAGDPSALERLAFWFRGAPEEEGGAYQPLHDRSMVEIGRERVSLLRRGDFARRYLVDLESGEIFCEQGLWAEEKLSVGPCPRFVQVSMARVEKEGSPRRIQLLQYAVSPHLEPSHWLALTRAGDSDYGVSLEKAMHTWRAWPGAAEPFGLVQVAGRGEGQDVLLVDDQGRAIQIVDEHEGQGGRALLAELRQSTSLSWVAGRWVSFEGRLGMIPISLAQRSEAGEPRLLRLR